MFDVGAIHLRLAGQPRDEPDEVGVAVFLDAEPVKKEGGLLVIGEQSR